MTHKGKSKNYQTIITNFTRWGEACTNLYAVLMIGSQARLDHQADEYSDLDMIMIVDDPALFIASDQWLKNIDDFYVSFVEDTIGGEKERRVLFHNALDVDFVILPKSKMNALNSDEAATILERGYHILIDKVGLQDIITPPAMPRQTFFLPTEQEFINIVNDFWYHSIWTVKKLKRGELWAAKFCLDSYMKWKLLFIIECHARAKHGIDYNTWFSGRFLEEWAEEWIVEKLSFCFSHYNREDIRTALHSTMDLFRAIAIEVAGMLHFQYPKEADTYSTAWVASE